MKNYLLEYEFNDLTFNLNPNINNNYLSCDIPLFELNGIFNHSLILCYSSKNNNESIFSSNFNLSFYNKISINPNNQLEIILIDSYGNTKIFIRSNQELDTYYYDDLKIITRTINNEQYFKLYDKYGNYYDYKLRGNLSYTIYHEEIWYNNLMYNFIYDNNDLISYITTNYYKFSFIYDISYNVIYIKIYRYYNQNYNHLSNVEFEYSNSKLIKIKRKIPSNITYEIDNNNLYFSIKAFDMEFKSSFSNSKISNIEYKYKDLINNNDKLYYKYSYEYYLSYTKIYDEIYLKNDYIYYDNNLISDMINDDRYIKKYECDSLGYVLEESNTYDILDNSISISMSNFDIIPYEDEEETYELYSNTIIKNNTNLNLFDGILDILNIDTLYKFEGCGKLKYRFNLFGQKNENISMLIILKRENNTYLSSKISALGVAITGYLTYYSFPSANKIRMKKRMEDIYEM